MNQHSRPIGTFTLTMINLAAILSLRNLPLLSTYGLSMIVFYLIAALTFFIPVALISADLAAMMPEDGGMYEWIRRAIGSRTAFLCVWLSLVTTVTALTLTLIFIATALAFAIDPALATNRYFTCSTVLFLTWGATALSLRGMRISGRLTAAAALFGTILPGLLIIGLGIYWILSHHPSQIAFGRSHLWPDFSKFSNVSFLAGIMFAFAGIEMSAYHVRDVRDPQRTFPRAILYSTVLILLISILGSLAIALVIPRHEILLEAGVIQSLSAMLRELGAGRFSNILGFPIAFGGIAFILAWISGPARGLHATRRTGDLPPFLQHLNGRGMPSHILIIQAAVVSLFALLFLQLPSISLGFWILNASSAIMILVMYFFLFLSSILLKGRRHMARHPLSVTGGRLGLLLLTVIGLANIIFCLVVGFILPTELAGLMGQRQFFSAVLGTTLLLSCPPFVFFILKKESWKTE